MSGKVCPILAAGWLGNKHAVMAQFKESFLPKNLPHCLGDECMAYDKDYDSCHLCASGPLKVGKAR
jgi:hypothetical protein